MVGRPWRCLERFKIMEASYFFTFLLQALIFSIIGFVRTTRMRHNDTVFYPALINLSMNMLYKGFILDPSLAKRTVNVILCTMTVHYQHCKNW